MKTHIAKNSLFLFFLSAASCMGNVAAAKADFKPDAAACLYENKSFSEGAFICVQKSVMLNCSSDGVRVTWKLVTEKDINDRCTIPHARAYRPASPHHAYRLHRDRVTYTANSPLRCFSFRDKRYCE